MTFGVVYPSIPMTEDGSGTVTVQETIEKSQDGRPPWRIVPVLVSPLSRVVPLPNGLNTFINGGYHHG